MAKIPVVMTSLILLAGCVTPAPRGETTFARYCAGCHGATGQGDGPAASELPVSPADLTQLSAANGGAFPTEDVIITVYGYPGKFNTQIMPEFGPLLEGRQVLWENENGELTPTPKALLDLVHYLETLQRP